MGSLTDEVRNNLSQLALAKYTAIRC